MAPESYPNMLGTCPLLEHEVARNARRMAPVTMNCQWQISMLLSPILHVLLLQGMIFRPTRSTVVPILAAAQVTAAAQGALPPCCPACYMMIIRHAKYARLAVYTGPPHVAFHVSCVSMLTLAHGNSTIFTPRLQGSLAACHSLCCPTH